MIETPAVLQIEEIVKEADYISIDTNDLMGGIYSISCDRNDSK